MNNTTNTNTSIPTTATIITSDDSIIDLTTTASTITSDDSIIDLTTTASTITSDDSIIDLTTNDECGQDEEALTRATNFSEIEDVQLCNSYLSVTCDPIRRKNETAQAQWDRILLDYNNRIPDNLKGLRNSSALSNRWCNVIDPQCLFFAGCLTQVLNARHSGENDALNEQQAKEVFYIGKKYRFTLMHCYKILSVQPKWMAWGVTTTITRPMGQKRAKALARKRKDDDETLARVQHINAERIRLSKERMERQRELHDLQLRANAETIKAKKYSLAVSLMVTNPSDITNPLNRQWMENIQASIVHGSFFSSTFVPTPVPPPTTNDSSDLE